MMDTSDDELPVSPFSDRYPRCVFSLYADTQPGSFVVSSLVHSGFLGRVTSLSIWCFLAGVSLARGRAAV